MYIYITYIMCLMYIPQMRGEMASASVVVAARAAKTWFHPPLAKPAADQPEKQAADAAPAPPRRSPDHHYPRSCANRSRFGAPPRVRPALGGWGWGL